MVFRLEVYPSLAPTPGSVANSYRSVYAATQTYPFRVRGSQVRVLDEKSQPAAGAMVYRLQEGQAVRRDAHRFRTRRICAQN